MVKKSIPREAGLLKSPVIKHFVEILDSDRFQFFCKTVKYVSIFFACFLYGLETLEA